MDPRHQRLLDAIAELHAAAEALGCGIHANVSLHGDKCPDFMPLVVRNRFVSSRDGKPIVAFEVSPLGDDNVVLICAEETTGRHPDCLEWSRRNGLTCDGSCDDCDPPLPASEVY